tara:strand:- start:430 stop:621 length:192 start_codon:yes stop_codon:yes gene_type:complete
MKSAQPSGSTKAAKFVCPSRQELAGLFVLYFKIQPFISVKSIITRKERVKNGYYANLLFFMFW